MKSLNVALFILIVVASASCSQPGKKVFIMSSGKITTDEKDQKTIRLEPGSTHNEKEIILTGGDKETLTVQSPAGNKTYEISENGNYVLNLKPDTLVGGIVNYGSGARTSNLTGEDVDHIIDSTQKLMLGQNASDANKAYFILPFTIKKLSSSVESRIVGPYNGIPASVDVGNSGKIPEVYKFYTNKQKREAVETLIKERKK